VSTSDIPARYTKHLDVRTTAAAGSSANNIRCTANTKAANTISSTSTTTTTTTTTAIATSPQPRRIARLPRHKRRNLNEHLQQPLTSVSITLQDPRDISHTSLVRLLPQMSEQRPRCMTDIRYKRL
jgi:hypothetical protein